PAEAVRQPQSRSEVVRVAIELLRNRERRVGARVGDVIKLVTHAVTQLEIRTDAPVILGEPGIELRTELDPRIANDLRELRVAARIRPVTRSQVGGDVREGVGRDERHLAPVADDLDVAAKLQTVIAALQGKVIEKLRDALVKEQRPVRSRRRAELRYA